MKHITYCTQRIHQIELVEIAFPDEMDDVTVSESTRLLEEGESPFSLPEGVEYTGVRSYEIESADFDGWNDMNEDDEPVRLARTVIQDHGVTYEGFQSFLENYDDDSYIQLILYLSRNGYAGTMDDMVREFYDNTAPGD